MTIEIPFLKSNEIHVWKVQCPFFSKSQKKILSFQTLQEIEKSTQFYHIKDQIKFMLTRASIRKILGLYLNLSPLDLEFQYNEFGKPILKRHLNSNELEFNISHSENAIVMAFALKIQLGIDVETIKPMQDMDDVAKIVFSPKEYNFYLNTSHKNKISLFYELWTRKESIIKALGTGFSYETKNFSIDLSLKNGLQIVEFHDNSQKNNPNWEIQSLNLFDDNKVAIACRHEIKNFHFYNLEW